jgi:asparagine synthase (glutamine-hydrolysing)
MCGILGGNIFEDIGEVENGLTSMFHRGTDGNTIFEFKTNDGYMYMTHNRLSIQDLSESANQPLISSDGRYYLAFNGELWKSTFEKFDKSLREKYEFKTDSSDSELLLYFLIEYKDNLTEMLNEIEGMFSFAFYDKEEDNLTLGRDFIGRLPLYYYFDGQYIAFSSEIKGLTTSLNLPYYNIDKGSKFNSDFKNKEVINIVEPGTFITYNKLGILNKTQYFSFKTPEYYPTTDEQLVEFEGEDMGIDYYAKQFRKYLEEAVDDELIADVPVCTILSGGIDSTVITYLLSKKIPNIESFVVNVQSEKNLKRKDDLHYARIASKEFGIKLHEVNITKSDVENYLEESIWASETHKWTQISPSVAQLFLSWEVRDKGYKVVFGGEGSDEIFASYGDVFRFCWPVPLDYHKRRVNLLNNLHKTNLIRTNKAMMYGGKVELRTPFLNKKLIDFGLRIPTKYRDENGGSGKIMKYVLRKAFEGEISDELLWRKKKTFQVGAHTDYLKKEKEKLESIFEKLFVNGEIPKHYIKRQIGHNTSRIRTISIS